MNFPIIIGRGDPDVGYVIAQNSTAGDMTDGEVVLWNLPNTDGISQAADEAVARTTAHEVRYSGADAHDAINRAGVVGPNQLQGGVIPTGEWGIIQVYGYRVDVKKRVDASPSAAFTAETEVPIIDGSLTAPAYAHDVSPYTALVGAAETSRYRGNHLGVALADSTDAATTQPIYLKLLGI